jgi:hypothetical protein
MAYSTALSQAIAILLYICNKHEKPLFKTQFDIAINTPQVTILKKISASLNEAELAMKNSLRLTTLESLLKDQD